MAQKSKNRAETIPRKLIRRYGTRDPFTLASRLGIKVLWMDTKKQKGFCRRILNNYFIFINSNMSWQMQRIACAHELGHILMHKHLLAGGGSALVELDLLNITNSTEYEANLFAASLLIDNQDLEWYASCGMDIVSIASSLDIDASLLKIKLAFMGLNIAKPDSRFLGKAEDSALS